MQNINIGKSGIAVPFLGMGTWAIGGGAWWGDTLLPPIAMLRYMAAMRRSNAS